MIEKEKELQRKERWKIIIESIYNEWYKWMKRERVTGYLNMEYRESR